MLLTRRQISKLSKAYALLRQVLREAEHEYRRSTKSEALAKDSDGGTSRRSAIAAKKMRDDVLAKRARGVSAASLADKYGVSTAYIYMIKK